MNRELAGKAVRDAWVKRQTEKHPGQIFPPWEEMSEFERETDRQIAEAVFSNAFMNDDYPGNARKFWTEQADWSQKTFGPDNVRGPTGPLKHLAKEVLVELLSIPKTDVNVFLTHALPLGKTDRFEYADLQFLIFDAARRAGLTYLQLIETCFEKLEINKARTWPAPSSDNNEEAVEHRRD